jgi:hypothetical protein
MPSLESIARDRRYIGQKVQVVLKAIGKDSDDHLFVDFEPGHLSGAAFHFDAEGWLYFYIDAPRHQAEYNPERKWDIEKFKQEMVKEMAWEED